MSKQVYEPELVERWRERARRFELSEIERRKPKRAKAAQAADFRSADTKKRKVERQLA